MKASNDSSKNWETMIELIKDYGWDGEDVLRCLTDWHGLQILDRSFMQNLLEELGEDEEEDEDE